MEESSLQRAHGCPALGDVFIWADRCWWLPEAISRVAFHPKIPVVATACDDHTWKMWSMPEGIRVVGKRRVAENLHFFGELTW